MSTKSKHKPVTLAKSAADYTKNSSKAAKSAETNKVEAEPVIAPVEVAKSASSSEHRHDAGDVTALYRGLAEQALGQAREAYAKASTEAAAFSGKLEESSVALTEGTSAVHSYVVKAIQAQADEAFGYVRALSEVKTLSDAITLQSSQSRKMLDASLRQFKDLSALMNDMTVKASTPIRAGFPTAKS